MGALQSKIWSEVSTDETAASPSEVQPLSSNRKPVAPFRDPRSISDDVERTPIQIAADKSKESSKSNTMPDVEQTPTGPSFAARFKGASIDPRSPGGLGLTRTPIILKEELEDEKSQEKKESMKENIDSEKPTRGTAAFVNRLQETAEMEELMESTSKMEIAIESKALDTDKAKPVEVVDLTEDEINDDTSKKSEEFENQAKDIEKDVALEADVSLPNYTENDNYGTQISKDEDSVSTPGNNRCGKKTMFPMVFAYEEAKSPRSPLGQMNLNSKFLASPVNSGKKDVVGSGDCSNNSKQAELPLPKMSLEETNMDGFEKENQNDTNSSLVI